MYYIKVGIERKNRWIKMLILSPLYKTVDEASEVARNVSGIKGLRYVGVFNAENNTVENYKYW